MKQTVYDTITSNISCTHRFAVGLHDGMGVSILDLCYKIGVVTINISCSSCHAVSLYTRIHFLQATTFKVQDKNKMEGRSSGRFAATLKRSSKKTYLLLWKNWHLILRRPVSCCCNGPLCVCVFNNPLISRSPLWPKYPFHFSSI